MYFVGTRTHLNFSLWHNILLKLSISFERKCCLVLHMILLIVCCSASVEEGIVKKSNIIVDLSLFPYHSFDLLNFLGCLVYKHLWRLCLCCERFHYLYIIVFPGNF